MYKPNSSVLVSAVPKGMVSFCALLGLKTGIDFAHFHLESSMVFEGVTGVYDCLVILNEDKILSND